MTTAYEAFSPDKIFSLWITAWAIIYIWFAAHYGTENEYMRYSPIFAIYMGVLFNIGQLAILYGDEVKPLIVALFLLMTIITKLLPLAFILRLNIQINWKYAIISAIVLFCIYHVYLAIVYQTNMWQVYETIHHFIRKFDKHKL